jgi:hypothetical protein
MKVDSRRFPESICTPESKSICDRGSHHKLLCSGIRMPPARKQLRSFRSVVPKQQNGTHVSII